ncbi:MAG: ThuA domain-containing protein [Deltaproteobacteria bacterium]
MRILRSAPLVVLFSLIVSACSQPIPELPVDAPSVLVFTKTAEYRHENIEYGLEVLETESRRRGIRIEATEDAERFTREELSRHRAVVFFNTTGDVLDDTQQQELERYIQAGGGFVGIHAAADTEWKENSWPWYTRLVGAAFRSHPNTPSNVQKAKVRLVNPNSPATATLPESWEREDEWYDYQRFSQDVDILLRVDESTYEGGISGESHPIAWQRKFDGGRSFYTGLGHTEESFDEDLFLDHLFGGLRFAMGDGSGAPQLDYTKSAPHRWRVMQEKITTGIGEPIAMEFTPEGDLYIVERNGRIGRWDATSGTVVPAGELDVYSQAENGLIGITFPSDFKKTHYGYLYYASDTGARPEYHLSRFEFRDGQVDLDSEKVLLRIPIDRGDTCHEGGDMQFDAAGNLWLSTGDDSNPHGIGGFAPIDPDPDNSIQNALRSAANSQDLRGKILRVHPEADGSYTIPAGNLFGPEDNARPEIYAMGLRNPFRFSFDDRTGILHWGEIGPDANDDDETRGPRGYDEVNRTTKPGFFGWPLFIAGNRPYLPWNRSSGEAAGPFFDPTAPRNDSTANSGVRALPEPQPSWIAFPYMIDEEFFELSRKTAAKSGQRSGRSVLAGPVYYSDKFANHASALPSYYDGKLLLYDFIREWVVLVEENEDGSVRKIEPLGDLDLNAPIDMAIAPDGSIWVLEYGSIWFSDNDDSGLSRISYFSGDNPPPVAVATLDTNVGAAPLAIAFDGTGSFDRNPDDELSYSWTLHDAAGESLSLTEAAASSLVVSEPGIYQLELAVTDTAGSRSIARHELRVGNAPPVVKIALKGNGSFYSGGSVDYRVEVQDTEDGSTADGGIQAAAVQVELLYAPAGFEPVGHQEAAQGLAALADNGCTACHANDQDSAGPALSAIAARYAQDTSARTRLAAKVIAGGGGNWGTRDMPANSHFTKHRAEELVDWILGLAPDRVQPAGLPLTGTIVFDQHADTFEQNEIMGDRSPAQYRLVASYRDRGGEVIGSLGHDATQTFVHPNRSAAFFDEAEGTLKVFAPEGPLVPDALAGEALLVATRTGGFARYEGIDLSGLDNLRIIGSALSAFMSGGIIEVRLDEIDGPLLGSMTLEATLLGKQITADIPLGTKGGVHDILLVFRALPGDEEADQGGALFGLLNMDFSAKKQN